MKEASDKRGTPAARPAIPEEEDIEMSSSTHEAGPRMLAAAALALLLAGSLTAEARSQDVLGTITANLGAKRHQAVTETNTLSISSTTYTQVTSTTISVPSSIGAARLMARFTAESSCSGTGGWCTLRILVDGFEMNPVVGTDYAWDSGGDIAGTASIDRTSGILQPGTHTVSVEARLVGAATLLALDDWQLTLEIWKASPPTMATGSRREDAPEPQVLGTFSSNMGAKRLRMVTETAPSSTASPTFTALTATTVTIPSSFNTARIVARFSGESACTLGNACRLRILVDGIEMNPASGGTSFDVPLGTRVESQSVERTSGTLSPGTHTVVVQWATLGGSTFTIDDWALVVAVWRVS
jgi:hypothetical protein